MVDYPTDQLDLGSESSSLRTWLLFAGVVALATLAGWVTYRLLTSVLH
jgi:hypothetical protein